MEKAPPTKRPRYDAAFRAEALRLASPASGLIVHYDRGGQYVGNAYKALLRDAKA